MVMITLLVCLSTNAQTKKVNQKTINSLTTSLNDNVISSLNFEIQQLQVEIDEIQRKINIIKNRGKKQASPTISTVQLTDYLNKFQTLSSLLRAESKDNSISEMLNKAEKSDIVDTYKLIIDLNNSLSGIYDANLNKALLKRTETMNQPLRKHQREVEPLISKVKNYKFVMYDLGDLLSEIKDYELTEDAESAARNLAQEYDVNRVLDYNYTNEILVKFISGELTEDEKHALFDACPTAFPYFKP